MIQSNQRIDRKLCLAALFGGSLLASLIATTSFAGGPPPQQGKPVSQPQTTTPSPSPSPSPSPQPAQPNTTGKPVEAQPATTQPSETKPTGTQVAPQTTPRRFPEPSARVTPTEGRITIKLVNTTNALIGYQVVGDTQQRTLGEQSEIQLKNLKAPVTITYQRQDGGLLLVRPVATATPGYLQVSFGATDDLGVDTKSLNVEEDGGVFLN